MKRVLTFVLLLLAGCGPSLSEQIAKRDQLKAELADANAAYEAASNSPEGRGAEKKWAPKIKELSYQLAILESEIDKRQGK